MDAPIVNIITHVLDDQKGVLMLIEKALQNAGIENYRLYTDEHEFLRDASPNVHIGVIDYLLPDSELNGIAICKRLLERNPRCWIIIMSGQGSPDVIIELLNSGAKRYVAKWWPNYAAKVAQFVNEGITEIKRDLDYYTLLLSRINDLQHVPDRDSADRIGGK